MVKPGYAASGVLWRIENEIKCEELQGTPIVLRESWATLARRKGIDRTDAQENRIAASQIFFAEVVALIRPALNSIDT
jgi:hypothetical protein